MSDLWLNIVRIYGSPTKFLISIKLSEFKDISLVGALNRIGLPYTERLLLLNLDSLEVRRIKSDFKMCFKIINGL